MHLGYTLYIYMYGIMFDTIHSIVLMLMLILILMLLLMYCIVLYSVIVFVLALAFAFVIANVLLYYIVLLHIYPILSYPIDRDT